jgi:hypothetical protein
VTLKRVRWTAERDLVLRASSCCDPLKPLGILTTVYCAGRLDLRACSPSETERSAVFNSDRSIPGQENG